MNVEAARAAFAPASPATEHFDVLIVGAGISGIGSAYHLRTKMPATSFVILETQETFGGTWWTHRYPGARSDSDLHTFGYSFKPWSGPSIATSEEIRAYLGAVIEDYDLAPHIRYGHRVTTANWSSRDQTWTVAVTELATGTRVWYTANFL